MKFSDLNKPKPSSSKSKAIEDRIKESLDKNIFVDKTDNDELGLIEKNNVIVTPKINERKKRDVRFSIRSEKELNNYEQVLKKDYNGKREVGKIKEEFDEDFLFNKSKTNYSLLIKMADDLFDCVCDGSYLKAYNLISLISEYIIKEFFEDSYVLNLIRYLTPKNYLISHTVNLSILAGLISKALNYQESETKEIVMSSLCIDLGMTNYKNLYTLERDLKEAEMDAIKGHVEDGIKIAEKIFSFEPDIKSKVLEAIYLSHERCDGSGYFKIPVDKLSEKSQIISVSDVYEAMTHRRSYRDPVEQPLVIYSLKQDLRRLFNHRAVRGLISVLSIYPPQSIVRLSTGEIAKVLVVNKTKPTRPVVKIIADGGFNMINPFVLDLGDYPLTSIETWIAYKDIFSKNPKLYREEEVLWLWIDW